MKDLTGTRVGSYEIVERLGGGGMAVVYRAVQQPLGREVALKALSPELFQDEGFVKRFEAEAKTLAKLDHPNILTIYDFELTEGVAYLTMPLIRGGTLRDIMKRGPLDTLTAWRYLREIGDGLQHAHDAGIVHRDLKPTNRSEEHTSELQSPVHLVCRLLLEKKKPLLSCIVPIIQNCDPLLLLHR